MELVEVDGGDGLDGVGGLDGFVDVGVGFDGGHLVGAVLGGGKIVGVAVDDPELGAGLGDGGAEGGGGVDADGLLDDLVEGVGELVGGGVAVGGIGGQGDLEDGGERGGDVLAAGLDRRDLAGADLLEDLDVVLAVEQAVAGEGLPEHAADAEQVGLDGVGLAEGDLGGEVGQLALDGAGGGEAGGAVAGPGEAEVGQLDGAVEAEQDVVGRDVAVDDGGGPAVEADAIVGGAEAAQGADRDAGGDGPGDVADCVAVDLDQGPEVDALDPFHDQVVGAALAAEVVDLDDVGVGELAADARLLDEHVDVVLERTELGLDVLDGDGALEPGGAAHDGLVDRGHPAFAGERHELVLAVDQAAAEIHAVILQRLSSGATRLQHYRGLPEPPRAGLMRRTVTWRARARPWRPRARPSQPPSAR